MKKNIAVILAILIILGGAARFYNLNWGAPYYFHPDERNIASAVSRIEFPRQMNPHFFAYGSLPIYTIYFSALALNFVSHFLTMGGDTEQLRLSISFENAIIISRLYSAFYSILLIPLLYFIGKALKDFRAGLITAFLTTTSTGLIQFAHFGTFEMWLTLLSVLFFHYMVKIIYKPIKWNIFVSSLILGAAISTKISHIVLFPIPMVVMLAVKLKGFTKVDLWGGVKNLARYSLLFSLVGAFVFFATNPFVILDEKSFIDSMRYESEVALGTLPVFYTGEFINSIPVVFQLFRVYPFLLNPLVTVIFLAAIIHVIYLTLKTKNILYFTTIIFFFILFLSQAFLFVKWARYMIPTLPFVYLIIGISFSELSKKLRKSPFSRPAILIPGLVMVFITSVVFAVSFFITTYVNEDTRVAAKNFAEQNIPSYARILSEVYDMGITPFNDSFPIITLFNFYDLDNNSFESSPETLARELEISEYIILPSQRILKTRLQNAKSFPQGHFFYSQLADEKNGFRKIYETPCDLFCRITYLNSPVFGFEQTVNVFDRPTLYIYKRVD